MYAELAYLFRHALMRDAAYGLQLPSDRAALHRLALEVSETVLPPSEINQPGPLARELAEHARRARQGGADPQAMAEAERRYNLLAGQYARDRYLLSEASQCFGLVADDAGAETDMRLQAAHSCARVTLDAGFAIEAAAWLDERMAWARQTGGAALANLLILRARAARALDEYTEALSYTEEAARIFQALGDHEGLLDTMMATATSLRRLNRPEEAETIGRQTCALAEELCLTAKHGAARVNLGALLRGQCRFGEARTELQRGIGLLQQSGDLWNLGPALGSLAILEEDQGNAELAITLTRESIEIARRTGNRHLLGMGLSNLAAMQVDFGHAGDAAPTFEQALVCLNETADRRCLAITLASYAGLLEEQGNPDRACGMREEAIRLSRQIGYHTGVCENLLGLAREQLRRRCLDQAEQLAREALDYARASQRLPEQAFARSVLCRVLLARGRVTEARTTWAEAWQFYAGSGSPRVREREVRFMHQACAEAGISPFE
ncbi:MAG: tetratricopeptide repeat protein [Planctomycetes bacterium]|nr:tetratricopeptide repeat protein [Planctomycetota bacterium]